jgi:hypothetical protein
MGEEAGHLGEVVDQATLEGRKQIIWGTCRLKNIGYR